MNSENLHDLQSTANFPYTLKEYALRIAWNITYIIFVRFSPGRMLRWRNFFLRLFGAKIGKKSGIKPSVKIFYPWLLEIGNSSILSNNVTVYNLGTIIIGDNTVISQDVYLCSGTHDYSKSNLPLLRLNIEIGNHVWIAAGAFIGPDTKIGDGSVIGARSVVFKDMPPLKVCAGNPCKVIKDRVIKQ
jgi:putative colanic acid biosynthesis acetyltransferase WcaF